MHAGTGSSATKDLDAFMQLSAISVESWGAPQFATPVDVTGARNDLRGGSRTIRQRDKVRGILTMRRRSSDCGTHSTTSGSLFRPRCRETAFHLAATS